MFQIRLAVMQDLPAIKSLLYDLNEFHQKNLPDDFKSPAEIEASVDLQKYIKTEDHLAIVACDKDQPVGFILGNLWLRKSIILHTRKIANVADIIVDRNFRGQGVGKLLMVEFEKQMKLLSAEEV